MYYPDPNDEFEEEFQEEQMEPADEFQDMEIDDRTGISIDPKKDES
jgi:hypothetical protein